MECNTLEEGHGTRPSEVHMKTQLQRSLWYHVLVTTLCSNYSPYYIVGALVGCILPKLDVKANLLLPTRTMLPSPLQSHKEHICR